MIHETDDTQHDMIHEMIQTIFKSFTYKMAPSLLHKP
jgi:hypothetical protein